MVGDNHPYHYGMNRVVMNRQLTHSNGIGIDERYIYVETAFYHPACNISVKLCDPRLRFISEAAEVGRRKLHRKRPVFMVNARRDDSVGAPFVSIDNRPKVP